MAKTPEGKVKDKVKKLLNSYMNVAWFMPCAGRYGRNGVGDFVCCIYGKYLEIETKALGKKQTPLQVFHEHDIRRTNGIYVVVDNDEEVLALENLLLKMGAALKVVMKDGRAVK